MGLETVLSPLKPRHGTTVINPEALLNTIHLKCQITLFSNFHSSTSIDVLDSCRNNLSTTPGED